MKTKIILAGGFGSYIDKEKAMLIGLLLAGWYLNPPYPFPLENNLAVVDFVQLQKEAAQYVESNYPGSRVASVWPFTVRPLPRAISTSPITCALSATQAVAAMRGAGFANVKFEVVIPGAFCEYTGTRPA